MPIRRIHIFNIDYVLGPEPGYGVNEKAAKNMKEKHHFQELAYISLSDLSLLFKFSDHKRPFHSSTSEMSTLAAYLSTSLTQPPGFPSRPKPFMSYKLFI